MGGGITSFAGLVFDTPALHFCKLVSTAGVAPAASTFAGWRSNLTELRGLLTLGRSAFVAGLSPVKICLKGRARELLCIHGRRAWRQQMVPEAGIAPASPRLQRSANLPQLLGGEWSSRQVSLLRPPVIGRVLCS